MSFNKLTLTPRNIRFEMFNFYREHLYPLKMPSFRHTFQWALQTDKYILNWQFDFGTQLHWAAVEANWQLALDCSAAQNIGLVEAAAVVPEKRGARPGTWADDDYTGISFSQVCMTAMDLREEENNERMERQIEEEHTHVYAHAARVDETATVDMSSLAIQLASLVDATSDSDSEADSECTQLPSYAEAHAQEEEANGTTMPDDDTGSEERKAAAVRKSQAVGRRRYVMEEADEDDMYNIKKLFLFLHWFELVMSSPARDVAGTRHGGRCALFEHNLVHGFSSFRDEWR